MIAAIEAQTFVSALVHHGIELAVSVPCSSIGGLLSTLSTDPRISHVATTCEAEAVGIAAGAWLAGRCPVLLMQNSGFLDSLNVIGSLLIPFGIPLPFLVTGRGSFGYSDEPHHEMAGQRTLEFAELAGLPATLLDGGGAELDSLLDKFLASAKAGGHGAILMLPVGSIGHGAGPTAAYPGTTRAEVRRELGEPADRDLRITAIAALRGALPDSLCIATTGHTGRELYATGDSSGNLYMPGSMGCASAIGLGLALSSDRTVVVLDGDGAMLMRMGNCATIGAMRPSRLLHVVLNNGAYMSTGGQANYGRSVDLAAVASACGYAIAFQLDRSEALRQVADDLASGRIEGPAFVDFWVSDRQSEQLPRPEISGIDQAARLRALLARNAGRGEKG